MPSLASPQVRMSQSKPGGKTSHSVQLVRVEEGECGPEGGVWVGANPQLGNRVARALLEQVLLAGPPISTPLSRVTSPRPCWATPPAPARPCTSGAR